MFFKKSYLSGICVSSLSVLTPFLKVRFKSERLKIDFSFRVCDRNLVKSINQISGARQPGPSYKLNSVRIIYAISVVSC